MHPKRRANNATLLADVRRLVFEKASRRHVERHVCQSRVKSEDAFDADMVDVFLPLTLKRIYRRREKWELPIEQVQKEDQLSLSRRQEALLLLEFQVAFDVPRLQR